MRVLKLVPLLSGILLFGGHILFSSSQAYAAWKPCCQTCADCRSPLQKCWCPGVSGCPYWYCAPHHPDDSLTMQAHALTNGDQMEITGSYSSLPSPRMRSYSIDRLIERVSTSQCDQNDAALKFFRNADVWLKFEPGFLRYNTSEDNRVEIVAMQMP